MIRYARVLVSISKSLLEESPDSFMSLVSDDASNRVVDLVKNWEESGRADPAPDQGDDFKPEVTRQDDLDGRAVLQIDVPLDFDLLRGLEGKELATVTKIRSKRYILEVLHGEYA